MLKKSDFPLQPSETVPIIHGMKIKHTIVRLSPVSFRENSITVEVEVYAQRRPEKEMCVKVTEATLTYVAVDENRQPRVVLAQPAG